MHNRFLLLIAAVVLFSCNKGKIEHPTSPTTPMPVEPAPTVFLKDIQIPNLPSPYYHFEYNSTGKPIGASFASGFFIYDIKYNADRIAELDNITVALGKTVYVYDNEGRVNTINIFDQANILTQRYVFTYNEQKLIKMERYRLLINSLVLTRTLNLSYRADGNLFELITHYHSVPAAGQNETIMFDWFDQYDNKINVDDFGLLRPEFFEHMIILPGIHLQKNNPGRVIHTGDGVNYKVDYTYTYSDKNAPLTKTGAGIWLDGPDEGKNFTTNSAYTYY